MTGQTDGSVLPRIEPMGSADAARDYGLHPGDLESICERFGHTDCFLLAIAIHERTGWPLKALLEDGRDWVHVAAVAPSGALVDAYGIFPDPEDVVERYLTVGPKWIDVTVEDVENVYCWPDDDPEDAHAVLDEPWMAMVLSAAGHKTTAELPAP